jgi:hypothetical protein
MKPHVSTTLSDQVLALRRSHSLREVADKTGIPLGTVKTICSRSGAFRDNAQHRALFTLPQVQPSTSAALTTPELPPQEAVTGDEEIDAVLWLRKVIETGQAPLIEKAKLAAQRIKTPLKELEDRYLKHLVSKNPGNWTVALQTFGFADLEGLAQSSTDRLTRQHEAIAMFGSMEGVFAKTPAEDFCIEALAGLKREKFMAYNESKVDARFNARQDLMPRTLSDCLYELSYWRDLYSLRAAFPNSGDHWPEVQARDDFAFRSLARIRPRSRDEAITVLRYLADSDAMDRAEANDILLNLIGR